MNNNYYIKKETMKDYDIKKMRMMKKLDRVFNKKLSDISKSEINNFVAKHLKSTNRSSYYDSVRILNNILKENGSDIHVNSREMVEDLVKVRDEQFFTRREIMEVCDNILNFSDKFIVYAMWLGLSGKANKDLLNIKVSDVADDYSYIIINGKKHLCDDYLKFLLKGTIKQKEYFKLINQDAVDNFYAPESYAFNMDSEYLLKSKCTKTTKNGTKPLSNATLARRLPRLEDAYEAATGEKIYLHSVSLAKSGIMYDMFMKEVNENVTWTIPKIEEYFKMNGYRGNAASIYMVYCHKYYGHNRIM